LQHRVYSLVHSRQSTFDGASTSRDANAGVLSLLVSHLSLDATQTELDRFTAIHPDTAIDDDTPCVCVGQL
jgi:hypothetical protein